MNLARQWHDDSTAAVSNVEPNAVAPNSKDKTNHPSSGIAPSKMAEENLNEEREKFGLFKTDALESFAVLHSSCTNTLKAIGHTSKFESRDSMWKIIERLPPKLQASWLNNADWILNSEARDVSESSCLGQSSLWQASLFGKEKKNSKDRGSKLKFERPGENQLSLVTISETKSSPSLSADVLSAVSSSKKN